MKYSGFNLKDAGEKERVKRALYQRRQSAHKEESSRVIYKAEYPVFVKKRELIQNRHADKTGTHADFVVQDTEGMTDTPEIKDGGSFSRVLCGILATVLCFTAVYLSGVKAPEYLQKGTLALVEYAKSVTSNRVSAVVSDKNTKTIGGKVFVEEMTQDSKNKSEIVAAESENSKFAQTIIESGASQTEEVQDAHSSTVSSNKNKDAAVQVVSRNMSKGSDKIYFTNRTNLDLDFDEILLREYPITKYTAGVTDSPLVLIVHTHGTEGYINSTDNNVTRSNDTDKNVVRVGKELAEVLRAYGIPVIHSETMHDEISYVKAYDNSKAEVKSYLSQYPSIKYVIDLHRDALGSDGDIPIKTYTSVNGEDSAQLMLVMGTNADGGNHPYYMNNLTVAANLQTAANHLYPDLMRPINVRPIIFNQNLAYGCMILEVGSDANTLEEALTAVRMFGRCFAQTICGESLPL